MEAIKKTKKKILVIVAHPDDETIWMGGLLLIKKNEWDTTVICLTRKSDADRYPKFLKVCRELKVKGFIYDLDDKNFEKPLNEKEIISIIKKHANISYDIIFTHNSNGEYGHIRHKDVHKAVKEMLAKNLLRAKEIFFFSYEKRLNDYQGYATYNSSADKLIKLNPEELAMKRKLAIDIYGYDRGGKGFEELSAGKIEAFDIYKK